ncbi:hypothetical protein GCM10007171_33360 [Dickeya fangzhongdai]|nr:hypothetical protein GCM10007171_33360 [Dickeya fangzhongdai]
MLLGVIDSLFVPLYFLSLQTVIRFKNLYYPIRRTVILCAPIVVTSMLQSLVYCSLLYSLDNGNYVMASLDWATEQIATGVLLFLILTGLMAYKRAGAPLLKAVQRHKADAMLIAASVLVQILLIQSSTLEQTILLLIPLALVSIKLNFYPSALLSGLTLFIVYTLISTRYYGDYWKDTSLIYLENLISYRLNTLISCLVIMLICEKNYAKRFAINIIKRKVYTDYLSGLYNRKFLWKKVQEIPKETTLSVLICDIDNFKHINDTYGHGNGDKIIQAVSHTIKTHISHHDLAVRWGGEEFLILSRSPDKPYLNTLSTRILDSIRELQITLDGDIARHVTVSIGGCTFEYRQSPDFVMAIETADKLLYQSKQAGKDRATLRILAQDTNESESYLPVLPSAEHEKL